MTRMTELHNKIFAFLESERKTNSQLRFALRKSDLGFKLSEGYWFYGNEDYVAISFWSGFDWKNKTPSISLILKPKKNEYYLLLSFKDSDEKRKTFSNYFLESLKILPRSVDHVFKKEYFNYEDPYEVFQMFYETDRLLIDEIIIKNNSSFSNKQNESNKIGFFTEEEFAKDYDKIKILQKTKIKYGLPYALRSISIKNYPPIRSLTLKNLDVSSQWIFFTGENGVGKTSVLKAIGLSIENKDLHYKNIEPFKNFKIVSRYKRKDRQYKIERNLIGDKKIDNDLIITGYAAYGTSRMHLLNIESQEQLLKQLNNYNSSLFGENASLLDFNKVFTYWRKNKLMPNIEVKFRTVVEVLTNIVPNLVDIHFGDNIEYFEADKKGKVLPPVNFNQLASGAKSLIAMIGDLLVRLFYQQEEIDDIAQLTGIVIIDEIELHFHPKFQRDFIEILSETFKKIQFIVTTHSPIPLLGAPKNSIFFTLIRDAKYGVIAKRLNFLETNIKNLLPNLIYTSDAFGMNDVTSILNEKKEDVWTSNNLQEELKYQELKNKFIIKKIDDPDFLNKLSKL